MARLVNCKLVGSYFHPPAPTLLKFLPAGAEVPLVREPTNEYDRNAIAVYGKIASIPKELHEGLEEALFSQGRELEEVLQVEQYHIGYIPKDIAFTLVGAKLPPAGKLAFDATGKPQVVFNTED